MLLEFLNQISGALTIVLDFLNQNSAAVIAIATIVYAFFTGKLVLETRRMREAQTEPKVWAYIQPKEGSINFIMMIVENMGLGPAYNIKFKVDPDFEYEKGKVLSDLGFVKDGWNYLSPKEKLPPLFLTNMSEDFEEKSKKSFNINITYEDNSGKIHENTCPINFSSLIGLNQLGDLPLEKIANNIENIKKDFDNLSTGVIKVKVIRYTKEEKEKEKEIKQLEEEKQQLLKMVNLPRKEGKE